MSGVFGPVETMLNVRGSTQLARNQLEIQMIIEMIKELKELEIQLEKLGTKSKGDMLPTIVEAQADFKGEPRLSWKLSSAPSRCHRRSMG